MRRIPLAALAAAALSLGAPAGATCLPPGPAPAQPNGAIATAAEMKAAHDAVQVYVRQLESYQACLEQQIANPPASAGPALKFAWREQGNAAIDQAQRLAKLFAAQLAVFNARRR